MTESNNRIAYVDIGKGNDYHNHTSPKNNGEGMSESEQSPKKKFTVSFKRSTDYRLYPATGIWGGPSLDATKLIVNFVADHIPTPNYQNHEILDDGHIDLRRVKDQVTAGDMERELLCGVILTLEDAKTIGNWLVQAVQDIESRRSR